MELRDDEEMIIPLGGFTRHSLTISDDGCDESCVVVDKIASEFDEIWEGRSLLIGDSGGSLPWVGVAS